jgi:hypothetical protein
MKSKPRRANGTYRTSYWNNLLPLVFLISSMVLGYFIQQHFKESELINPCEDGCSFFMVRAYEEPVIEVEIIQEPKTEKQQIIEYITQVFKEDAPDAFNILHCENRQLNPKAVNHNRNGTRDLGIFQLNDAYWGGEENFDWKTNIDKAHKIFKNGGWRQWSCSHRIGIKPFYLK